MKLTRPLLSQTVPLTLVAACGAVASDPAPAPPPAPTADIAALRARGRVALYELLDVYDTTPAGPQRVALADTIDRVAAQRYATTSRLYWHTELAAALAEARATGKPILSLRMLGRLDHDLSCANSRFFRTILYPDPAVSALLRHEFVLHWSSERPVPTVTIDFGDGRKIVRTTTGNSVHYVLDRDGNPIDALPGLYAPAAFGAELERARALHVTLADLDGPARDTALRDHHRARMVERERQWNALGRPANANPANPTPAAATLREAQLRTMTKRVVEVRDLVAIDAVGPALPGTDDLAAWTAIGRRLYPKLPAILSREARDLVTDVIQATGDRLDRAAVGRMLARLESTTVADTAINELQLRPMIRRWFVDVGTRLAFDHLNQMIYSDVFATPASDRWLGLLPRDVYTGLPGDGVVQTM